jgi:hypothetical protein
VSVLLNLSTSPTRPEIDIKPDSDVNPVNPMSQALIPVQIRGSATFDVTEIDRTTLAFGSGVAPPAHDAGGHIQPSKSGGFGALLSHFATPETGAAFESRPLFDLDLLYRDPSYPKVSWAGEGQFPPLLDLFDAWHGIDAKGQAGMSDFSAEIAELSSHVPSEIEVYRTRIDQLTRLLLEAATELNAAASCGE